jgi:HPr Serine kinase C-terminal domain
MQIIEDTSSSANPPVFSHFRGLRHLVFAMIEPGGFLSFDLLRRRIMGILSPAAAADPSFWNSRLLPISVGVLGTTLGLAPLHCACLDRHGAGLLIAGNSGAGKSTLTAALAKRGFAVVSDDWTYASTHHGNLVAHGLFAPIKLLPDAIRFFPELRDSTLCKTLDGELAHELDPAKFFHSQWKASSVPEWLLFLERTSLPDCRFIPCPPAQVLRFFEQNAEKLPAELPEAASTRSAIIGRLSSCKSWILRTGDDPIRTAAAIDEFLTEV